MLITTDFSKYDQKYLKGRNAEYTVEDLNELFERYINTDSFKSTPYIKLSEDVEENFESLYKIFNKVKDHMKLPNTIIKSYVMDGQEEKAVKCLKLVDGRIASPQGVLAEFMVNHLLTDEECETLPELKRSDDVDNYFYEIMAKRLTERFPKYIFLDLSDLKNSDAKTKNMRMGITHAFERCGIQQINIGLKDPQIFLNPDAKPEVDKRFRSFFKNSFKSLVEKYVKDKGFSGNLNQVFNSTNRVDEIRFKNVWDFYEEVIGEYISVFDDEEKRELKSWIDDASFLFDCKTFNNLHSNITRGGRFGEDGKKVADAISNTKFRQASAEDEEVLKSFYKKALEVKRALEIESYCNGRSYNYPTNYFKVCDMDPPQFYYCLIEFKKLLSNEIDDLKLKIEEAGSNERKKLNEDLKVLYKSFNDFDDARILFIRNFPWALNGKGPFNNNARDKSEDLTPEQIIMAAGLENIHSITNPYEPESSDKRIITKKDIYASAVMAIKYVKEHNLGTNNLYVAKAVFDSLRYGHSPLSEEYGGEKVEEKKVEKVAEKV